MRRLTLWTLLLALSMATLAATPRGQARITDLRSLARHHMAIATTDGLTWPTRHRLSMPDGTRLATDVYMPQGTGPWPTILVRLPYGKTRFGAVRGWLRRLVPRGYAVVVQDMRGRWASEGQFRIYPHEASDGAATLDWIAAQPWSTGQVATVGCSGLGEVQVLLAGAHHPAHATMVAMAAGGALGSARNRHSYFGMFEGGVPTLAAAVGWFATAGGARAPAWPPSGQQISRAQQHLPIRDAVASLRSDTTEYRALLDGLTDPDWRSQAGFVSDTTRFGPPALLIDTWSDYGVGSTLLLTQKMRAAGVDARALIGPGTHCDMWGAFERGHVGDLPVTGPAPNLDAVIHAALGHALRGGPATEAPPYRVYVQRADRWLDAQTWPPAAATERLFHLDGPVLGPVGSAGARSFVSDPSTPVPTLGGAICCTGDPTLRAGPVDQSPLVGRRDVLVYESAPLDTPLTIAGPVSARIWVETDRPDADLVLRLSDAAPGGPDLLIQEGALRLRYRHGLEQPRLLTAGEIVEAQVTMRATAWRVPAGHRLRLHVAGSSFPRLARNPGFATDPHRETRLAPAQITVHSGPTHPSHLRVYVMP